MISLSGLSNINANGTDIRFTSSDGTTQLPREIESYSAGTLTAWVKIPTLSYTADTVIYMYYGNTSVSEPAADSTYGSQNVWTSSFGGVWHMDETGTGTAGDYKDSTVNAKNSTSTTNQPTIDSSGKINSAESFDGVNNVVSIGAKSDFNGAQFTVDFWVYTDVFAAGWNVFVSKEVWNAPLGPKGWFFYRASDGDIIFTRPQAVGDEDTSLPIANGWHHVVGTYNGTGLQLWVDGVHSAVTAAAFTASTDVPLYFGARHQNDGSAGAGVDTGEGVLDEIRYSSGARSEGWIATEYSNQNSPSTFESLGSQETAPTLTPTPTTSSSSTSSSPSFSSSSPSCGKTPPAGTPNLYQVDATETDATLYFTPVSGADSYFARYGTDVSANQYATSFSYSDMSGAVAYTIQYLQPRTTYYFTVRAGNGCATGNWSNVKSSTVPAEDRMQNPGIVLGTTEDRTVINTGFEHVPTPTLIPILTPIPIEQPKAPEGEQTGVVLDVRVLAANNKPAIGATVTIHSKVQTAKTDANGVAHFENIETGDHRVLLAYNGYNGEQKLTVDGTKKEQSVTLQVNMNNRLFSPILMAVFGSMAAVILFLLFIILKKRCKAVPAS